MSNSNYQITWVHGVFGFLCYACGIACGFSLFLLPFLAVIPAATFTLLFAAVYRYTIYGKFKKTYTRRILSSGYSYWTRSTGRSCFQLMLFPMVTGLLLADGKTSIGYFLIVAEALMYYSSYYWCMKDSGVLARYERGMDKYLQEKEKLEYHGSAKFKVGDQVYVKEEAFDTLPFSLLPEKELKLFQGYAEIKSPLQIRKVELLANGMPNYTLRSPISVDWPGFTEEFLA